MKLIPKEKMVTVKKSWLVENASSQIVRLFVDLSTVFTHAVFQIVCGSKDSTHAVFQSVCGSKGMPFFSTSIP